MNNTIKNNEKAILRRVTKEFETITGMNLEIKGYNLKKYGYDVELVVRRENRVLKLYGEIKTWITKNNIGQVIHWLKKTEHILITRYVTNEVAAELKKENVQFIDTAGNAYINIPPIFIYIKGNKLRNDKQKPTPLRLFRKTGLKVLFVILSKPEILNAPLRNIAYAGDTALGTVAYVFEDLRKLGYLHKKRPQTKVLVRKDELFKKWVENYNETLRPTLIRGKYTTNNKDWWKYIEPKEYNIYWGGEVGANLLTKYLKPELKTIYTDQNVNKLILKSKLLKQDDGEIEILNKFWRFEYDGDKINVVPPLLVYAELIRIPDERNHETAKIIYEKCILKLIE